MEQDKAVLTDNETNGLAYSYLIASEQIEAFWQWCQDPGRREAVKIARSILAEDCNQDEAAAGARRLVALLEMRTAQVIRLTKLLAAAKAPAATT